MSRFDAVSQRSILVRPVLIGLQENLSMHALFCFLAVIVAAVGMLPPVQAHEHGAKGVTVVHPWARATPKGAKVGAAYFEIRTAEGTTDRLIGGKSPVAGKVEIHTHIHDDGVMRMRKIPGVDLAANSSHVLKPSGDHLMLLDLKGPLKEGETLKITLVFEKAGEIEIDATIEPIGARGPHGLDHQPVENDADHSQHGGEQAKPQEHKH